MAQLAPNKKTAAVAKKQGRTSSTAKKMRKSVRWMTNWTPVPKEGLEVLIPRTRCTRCDPNVIKKAPGVAMSGHICRPCSEVLNALVWGYRELEESTKLTLSQKLEELHEDGESLGLPVELVAFEEQETRAGGESYRRSFMRRAFARLVRRATNLKQVQARLWRELEGFSNL